MRAERLLQFKDRRPRRNLPTTYSRKRGESNFVSSFARIYLASTGRGGIGGKEFALPGFGIADFVWIAWRHDDNPAEDGALSIEKMKLLMNRRKLTAFEMKLSDWRKGLVQAYRYSYFADLAVVVLPPDVAAIADVKLFRNANIGLWSFDQIGSEIQKIFTPRCGGPISPQAKDKAVDALGRRLKFR